MKEGDRKSSEKNRQDAKDAKSRKNDFVRTAEYLLEKNSDLYRRLARHEGDSP